MSQNGSQLHRAIELAVKAHAGQDDPPGEPYILHPMRVMLSLPDADKAARCVAILHDAVERGTLTKRDLEAAELGDDIVEAIALLTHAKGVSYADYIAALKPNRLAKTVKLADLMDNADLRYVDFPIEQPKKGRRRTARYALSYHFLSDLIDLAAYQNGMRHAEA